jgi:hypothetical protein
LSAAGRYKLGTIEECFGKIGPIEHRLEQVRALQVHRAERRSCQLHGGSRLAAPRWPSVRTPSVLARQAFSSLAECPTQTHPRHPVVDYNLHARHIAGRVGGKEQNPVRDVLSLSGLPQRHPGFGHFVGSIGALLPEESGNLVHIGVSIIPGWTVLTLIPSAAAAHSIATASRTGARLPWYAIAGQPCRPAGASYPRT